MKLSVNSRLRSVIPATPLNPQVSGFFFSGCRTSILIFGSSSVGLPVFGGVLSFQFCTEFPIFFASSVAKLVSNWRIRSLALAVESSISRRFFSRFSKEKSGELEDFSPVSARNSGEDEIFLKNSSKGEVFVIKNYTSFS